MSAEVNSDMEGPPDMTVLFEECCRLCDIGQYAAAATIAEQLLGEQPDNPQHCFLLGTCLQRLGQTTSAAALFWLALTLQPSWAYAFRLAECLRENGHTNQAIRAFDRAASLAATGPDCWHQRNRARQAAAAITMTMQANA